MADATKIGVADATKMGGANARVAYLLPPYTYNKETRHCYKNSDCPQGYACDSGGECKKVLMMIVINQ